MLISQHQPFCAYVYKHTISQSLDFQDAVKYLILTNLTFIPPKSLTELRYLRLSGIAETRPARNQEAIHRQLAYPGVLGTIRGKRAGQKKGQALCPALKTGRHSGGEVT